MSANAGANEGEGLAIVGLAGRFPGAQDADEFWENLRQGRESISILSDDELRTAGVGESLLRDPSYIKARAILADADLFDAAFFGLSPREADITDPQQRLFLECVWEALEHAGYAADRVPGTVGVYAGVTTSTYVLGLLANPAVSRLFGTYQIGIGNDKDHIATRVAYKLNFRGPAIAVQTACSTSLVAVALACESLLSFQCDVAIAGGASITFPQVAGYLYQEGGIHSPDGHCRAFDAAAKGSVAGSGVGVVVLKRLSDAINDGDCIYAVIKGFAVNNDGSGKVGFTAPSVEGQAEVIAMAHAMADVPPDSISYVEAHGTGTVLGDPIELAALTQAFRAGTARSQFCAIGSVKPNVGHLDAAAGVVGLIKTVLALYHREIPASLNFVRPNPEIDFATSPFYVNDHLSPWPLGALPRRAGVSSFGVGGTNAHVVLEESPSRAPSGSAKPTHLLLLSARSESALECLTTNLVSHLKSHPSLDMADVAYTLQLGRSAFPHRRMLVCRDCADAVDALESRDPQRVLSAVAEPGTKPVAFLFPGQGAQHMDMLRDLYAHVPLFREEVDRCAGLLGPHFGSDLRTLLYPDSAEFDRPSSALEQTAVTQPALFTVEYALAQVWIALGVTPTAMIGHSLGEYTAACIAGTLSLESALELVAARGRLMQQVGGGAMLAVPLGEAAVEMLLDEQLSIAAINSPSMTVVSGPDDHIARLEQQLVSRGLPGSRLRTANAFHSAMMTPVLQPFAQLLGQVPLSPPRLPFLSNVTGTWATNSVATPDYWRAHARQPVRFAQGLAELLAEPSQILLEVGPGQTLSRLARQQPACTQDRVVVSSARHRKEQRSDLECFLTAVGRVWLTGIAVDMSAWYRGERRRRVPLPTYPFERQSHWIGQGRPGEPSEEGTTTAQRRDLADWFSVPSWRQVPRLLDHDERTVPAQWLLLTDTLGLGEQLANRLQNSGDHAVRVMAGSSFSRPDSDTFTLDPRRPDDYRALLRELIAMNRLPQTIVHMWNVSDDSDRPAETALAEDVRTSTFMSLIYLAQAWGDMAIDHPLQLDIVSTGLHGVTGGEMLAPLKALLVGPCRVIAQEYPSICCRSVDLMLPSSDLQTERLLGSLVQELRHPPSERVVAFRGPFRWVPSWEPVRLEQGNGALVRLREGGIYMITGGLGGIGLTVADYLARRLRATLVLVGRTALPDPSAWEQWLADHHETDRVSGRIRAIRAMEAAGARVVTVAADVADRAAMTLVVRETREQFGVLHGVIHAAGVAGGGVIQRATVDSTRAVLAAKVEGTLALQAALGDVDLDFLLLCSSLSAVLGGAGRIDYCAANAFLDAFAQSAATRTSGLVLSVNWDTWQQVGMAVDADLPLELDQEMTRHLTLGIQPEEGVEALRRILAASLPNIAVSTRSLPVRVRESEGGGMPLSAETGTEQRSSPRHARPAVATSYVAPRTEIERSIARLWEELLGVDRVGLFDSFFELGGHSLLAIQLIARLRARWPVPVTLEMLFDIPTVAGIAGQIEHGLPSDDATGVEELLDLVERLSEEATRSLLSTADVPVQRSSEKGHE